MAAIITIHTDRNHPKLPSGPDPSCIRIRADDHHQPTARVMLRATVGVASRRLRTRPRIVVAFAPLVIRATTSSRSPGELCRRQAGLSLVLDPKALMHERRLPPSSDSARRDGTCRRSEWLTGFDTERHGILDLEVDDVTHSYAVSGPSSATSIASQSPRAPRQPTGGAAISPPEPP
jgi:hypothetical protein